jgi:molybdenum cofactor guanylyltransferase
MYDEKRPNDPRRTVSHPTRDGPPQLVARKAWGPRADGDAKRRRRGSDATAGIILAGGRSRRFGPKEKLTATVGGRPLVRRVADALAGVPEVDDLIVSCRSAQVSALERALGGVSRSVESVEFVPDRVPDRGPLGGFETALTLTGSRDVVVAAGDLPLVTTNVFDTLLSEHDRDCTVAVAPDGRRQPLCAVYRRSPTAAALEATLEAGPASVSALLARLDVHTVRISSVGGRSSGDGQSSEDGQSDVDGPSDRLANVNTCAELQQVRDQFSGELR